MIGQPFRKTEQAKRPDRHRGCRRRRAMNKAVSFCLVFVPVSTSWAAEADMSKKAAFDEACQNAIVLVANSYYDQTPPSARASANVMMCNGHPSQMICEISSQVMLREYGKTPFTCGSNVADSVPSIFPADK
jgi:hypothetical protein